MKFLIILCKANKNLQVFGDFLLWFCHIFIKFQKQFNDRLYFEDFNIEPNNFYF